MSVFPVLSRFACFAVPHVLCLSCNCLSDATLDATRATAARCPPIILPGRGPPSGLVAPLHRGLCARPRAGARTRRLVSSLSYPLAGPRARGSHVQCRSWVCVGRRASGRAGLGAQCPRSAAACTMVLPARPHDCQPLIPRTRRNSAWGTACCKRGYSRMSVFPVLSRFACVAVPHVLCLSCNCLSDATLDATRATAANPARVWIPVTARAVPRAAPPGGSEPDHGAGPPSLSDSLFYQPW